MNNKIIKKIIAIFLAFLILLPQAPINTYAQEGNLAVPNVEIPDLTLDPLSIVSEINKPLSEEHNKAMSDLEGKGFGKTNLGDDGLTKDDLDAFAKENLVAPEGAGKTGEDVFIEKYDEEEIINKNWFIYGSSLFDSTEFNQQKDKVDNGYKPDIIAQQYDNVASKIGTNYSNYYNETKATEALSAINSFKQEKDFESRKKQQSSIFSLASTIMSEADAQYDSLTDVEPTDGSEPPPTDLEKIGDFLDNNLLEVATIGAGALTIKTGLAIATIPNPVAWIAGGSIMLIGLLGMIANESDPNAQPTYRSLH